MNVVKKPQVQYAIINVKGVLDELAPAYADSIELAFNQLQFLTAKIGEATSPTAASVVGMAAANMQMTLKHPGIGVHVDAITRILEHHPGAVGKHARTLKPPCAGDMRGCEEKMQKVRGRKSYVVAVMGLYTKFIPAWDISSPTKKQYGAAPLLRAARDMAGGMIPRLFIADGPDRHHIAFKKAFDTLKGASGPSTYTTSTSGTSHATPTSRSASTGGGFAGRFRYARGINKEESPIFRMAVLHYNYIKPHGGMGGRTPAEAVGIHIRGMGRWLTLIQNTVSAA